MIEGKDGVRQRILQLKAQKDSLKNENSQLLLQYRDMEEAQGCFEKKKEEFQQLIAARRARAGMIAECTHPPCFAQTFSSCLREELYGQDYETAAEDVESFGKEIEKEKAKLSEEIRFREEKIDRLEEEILALERLLS